jgi:hypothetical protein
LAARNDDAQSSSVVSKDAPPISTLPVTRDKRSSAAEVQL